MTFTRSGGILLHPTSLPGPYGIGDLGPQAYTFIDWLSAGGCKLWQILPLGPTGYGDSPYQCFSAFAGNQNLISPDLLVSDGILSESDIAIKPEFPKSKVDFGKMISWKHSVLERAFKMFRDSQPPLLINEFEAFRDENRDWLDDFSLFMALKEAHGGGSWADWPAPLRKRALASLDEARQLMIQPSLRQAFYQFLFFRQWNGVRKYAQDKGIVIIGDIPLFVSADSADVWAHPELFYLDDERHPSVVAGVPPDYFSPTGQLWGNPLYNWEAHKESGYSWWLARFRAILRTVDIIRLDHFRGFAGYWEIPAGSPTAEIGRWVAGPGAALLDVVAKNLRAEAKDSDLPIIAEDLGVITPDVVELRERYHLPGMKILQFAFSGSDNPFLPHNFKSNCVAYTGTHDNDTARGWMATAPKPEIKFALRYMRSTLRNFGWDLIRLGWSSVAVFAIAPMQDLLDLGSEARMNYPNTLGGNWSWRMREEDMRVELAAKMRELNDIYWR